MFFQYSISKVLETLRFQKIIPEFFTNHFGFFSGIEGLNPISHTQQFNYVHVNSPLKIKIQFVHPINQKTAKLRSYKNYKVQIILTVFKSPSTKLFVF